MQLFAVLVTLFSALLASASVPSRSVGHAHRKRAVLDTSQRCGLWDLVTAGKYTLYLNQWGASGATGQQCARLTALSGSTIAWHTSYDWMEGSGIKSFTNIQLNAGINKQLSAITSMTTSWEWSMSSTSIVADVAFDLFISDAADGSNVHEMMIWLANYNSGPLSYQYTAEGQAKPIASNIAIAGYMWTLYAGTNGVNNVFSFLTASGPIPSFHGNILGFFKYLIKHHGVSPSQYLITAQAGSELTSGSATFTTKKYSLSIN